MSGTERFRRDGDELVIPVDFGEARIAFVNDAEANDTLGVEGVDWEDLDRSVREEVVLGQVRDAIGDVLGESGE